MSLTIQADESGTLVLPAGIIGQVEPGAKFSVEAHGNVVILRRQPDEAERWWATTTPAERVAWLHEWVRSLPSGPPIPIGATHRASMYE